MPLFVAFPEAGAVSKRCLGSCQSAPEHVRPRLKAKSSKTLQSGTSGYTYLSGVRPGMKSDRKEVDYGNVETDADAILDVWFVAAGYLSTSSSLNYLPWVRVIARLVSSQTRQPIYFQMLNYGAVLKAEGIVDLPADPIYKYGTAGTLLGRADQAADGLRGSIQPIAARIVEDLR